MSVFNTKKVIVKKVENQDKISFFINYSKVKKHNDFVTECMQKFNSDYDLFVVINSNIFYNDPKLKMQDRVNLIKEELDAKEIRYQEIVTKKDNEMKVFGIPVKRPEMVNSYQIGIILSPGEFQKIEGIVENINYFCYINCDQIEKEEMFHKFNEVGGDYEDLSQVFELSLYIDYNLKRVCIHCSQKHVKFAEEKINRILNRYN